jgi:trehalose-phosphatase
MNHLLQLWPTVANRIREARAIALFLDFDGTLSPFVADPAAARLPPLSRAALQRLASRAGMRIWIISSRRQDDVRARIGVARVECLGLYGWENGSMPRFEPSQRRMLSKARAALEGPLHEVPGVHIEDKQATFAIHWRSATPDTLCHVASVFHKVMTGFDKGLRVVRGDHVWEVTPRGLRGKGTSARQHWRSWCSGALPIYLGDSAADESAFAALGSGITVCVGPARNTRAHFRLRHPMEVRVFLEKLEMEIR